MSGSDPGWATPGGEERPRWGERVPGAETPAPVEPAGAVAAVNPQWTPPPKPGLVPLHPLGFGQLLGIAFAAIRWDPRATILPAVLINLVQTGVLYTLGLLVALPGLDRVQHASPADQGPIIAGLVAQGSGIVLLSIALGVIGGALLQGIVVTVVARGALGERPGAGTVLRAALARLLPLVGLALLIGAAELVVVLLLAAVVTAVAVTGGFVGVALSVVIGLVGLLGLAALVLWVTTKLSVAPSAIVIERLGVIAAVRRSWRLTRGAFWPTLGLILLVGVIVAVAAQAVALPVSIVGGAITGVLAPNSGGGDAISSFSSGLVGGIPAGIVTVVATGIGQIAQAAAVALVYLDRRMRREGLDLDLQRAAEQPGGPDPFRPR